MRRLVVYSLIGATLGSVVSLFFPGILYAILSPFFPAGLPGISFLLLGVSLFFGYFVTLVFAGLIFSRLPRVWSLILAAMVIIVAIVFLSPEAAIVDLFGLSFALLEDHDLGRRGVYR